MQTSIPTTKQDVWDFAVVWTRDDCDALEKSGYLTQRYELIEGVIVQKMSQHIRHARLVAKALFWLAGHFGEDRVLTQASMLVSENDTSTSRPEPDVIVLNKPGEQIPTDEPRPEDIRLLIEIAHTTLRLDLNTKAALYARAGIPEYWVVSIDERRIYRHTDPQPSGIYTRTELSEHETITLSTPSTVTAPVADFLL